MKLIDADALWMEFIHRMDYCDDILEIVDEMPEAVVRCKDCVFFESGIRCTLRNEQTGYNDYCSRGIRRTDG